MIAQERIIPIKRKSSSKRGDKQAKRGEPSDSRSGKVAF